MKPRKSAKLGKKAFITDVIVDFWAYFVFVLIVIVFAVLFKLSSEAQLQALEGVKDLTYGNYLAQVYLRTPIVIGNTEMTMAELIAMYDYNQSMIKPQDQTLDYVFSGRFDFVLGQPNPMKDAIMGITGDFVENNFHSGRCWMFAIHGKNFDYNKRGEDCMGAEAFSIHYLLSQLENVPKEAYVTYIAPVDPRQDPIAVYSIFDIQGLLAAYSDDPFFDMDVASQWAVAAGCQMNSIPLIYDACKK